MILEKGVASTGLTYKPLHFLEDTVLRMDALWKPKAVLIKVRGNSGPILDLEKL